MCFSASVSFGASGVLAGLGAASIASNDSPQRRLFAATPLLFAAQQAAEGFVWLTIAENPHGVSHQLAINAFLVLALIVWPVWLPAAFERTEENVARRQLLHAVRLFGTLVAVGSATLLIRMRPEAVIVGHSLHYDFAYTTNRVISTVMLVSYLIPTVLPMFISTASYARRIGLVLVFSVVAASMVQREALTSVWCFFASLVSGTFLFAVRGARAPRFQHTPRLEGGR